MGGGWGEGGDSGGDCQACCSVGVKYGYQTVNSCDVGYSGALLRITPKSPRSERPVFSTGKYCIKVKEPEESSSKRGTQNISESDDGRTWARWGPSSRVTR